MSQALPYGGFKWSTATLEDIMSTPDDSEIGYVLEVDLQVPLHLHDKFNQYPLAPEHCLVQNDELSPESKELLSRLNVKHNPVQKLVPNLRDKKNYVLHYRNLKLYTDEGLIVTDVHKVLEFKQKPWLKSYIDFNTEKRKEAKNSFEKSFYKLCNNSVFGKTIESIRKRTSVQLVHKERKFKKIIAKPNVKRFKRFNKGLAAIDLDPVQITLNRPVYAGMAVLDLSKHLMYNFYYAVLVPRYGDKMKLCFTDTDSFCLEIKTENIYNDVQEMKHHFDCSDYDKSHFLYSEANKKKIGLFKDETAGVPIEQFVGLRPKVYSLKYGEKCSSTCKGTSSAVRKKRLKHEHYVECLFESTLRREVNNRIGSENHIIYSMSTEKIALSPFDDKRYVLDNGYDTLAHGHKDIPQVE